MKQDLFSRPNKRLVSIRDRKTFLKLSKRRRIHAPGFLLQGIERRTDRENGRIRIGYVCSKKLGNAVARNRAKRRLRAVAKEVLTLRGRSGWDYLLVGRPAATVQRDFRLLCAELESALRRLHA